MNPTAAIIVIGNEILSGRTHDKNGHFLAGQLTALGIDLVEVRFIRDDHATIISTVNELRARHTYVFTTGGIGPTHDDITTEAICKAFALPMIANPEAVARLKAHYAPDMLNAARLRMANTPEGAELIDNPVSAAPGYRIENVYVMAGVPSIMQAMFGGIKHTLTGGVPVQSRTVSAFVTEGTIAAELTAVQEQFPDVEIGSYPFIKEGRLGTSLVARAQDAAHLAACEDALKALVERFGAFIPAES